MITLTSSSPVELMFLGVCSNRSFTVGRIVGVRAGSERNIVTIKKKQKKRRSCFYIILLYLIYPYRLKEISLSRVNIHVHTQDANDN